MKQTNAIATRGGAPSLRFAATVLRRTRIGLVRVPLTGIGLVRAPGTRAAAFAAALRARQAMVVGRLAPLAFVQRQARAHQWFAETHRHWYLAFMPRLQVELASSTKAASPAMPTAFAPPRAVDAPRMAPTFVSTLLQSIAVRGERVDSIRFLQQTIQAAATTRIERTATTVHIATPAAQDARAERVHRAAAAAPGRSAATSPRRHDAAPAAAPARSAEPAAQLARTADLNIDRLADRVVHAIDRRLVAQRERHGRL